MDKVKPLDQVLGGGRRMPLR